jgi:hypothetical protein
MQVPTLPKIATQRVHFFAPSDKTSLEHSGAAIRIGCLSSSLGCLDRNKARVLDPRSERIVGTMG